MGGTALVIDVLAVGADAHGHHFRAEFPEGRRRHLIGRAIGAIDHDLQPIQPDIIGQRAFHRVDIAAARVFDAPGAPDFGAGGQRLVLPQHGFDRQFILVRQLEAVRAEQLDAIVLIGIVAGRDHHAHVSPQFPRQQGHGGSRHGAEQDHVHAHAGKARNHGVFQHIAGKPRVLADHHPVAVLPAQEVRSRRLPHLHGGGRCHHTGVGPPANPVGAEKLPSHAPRFR